MQVREAKDFLVQETAKQASLEGVPVSELEKRWVATFILQFYLWL